MVSELVGEVLKRGEGKVWGAVGVEWIGKVGGGTGIGENAEDY